MHHGIFKPILFDIVCHYIGNGLDFIAGIAHGNTDITVAQHIKIILAIAKAYCISLTHVKKLYHIDDLRKLLGDEFVVTLSSFKEPEPYSGEITLRGVNKATGIRDVVEFLHMSQADTIFLTDTHI